MFNGWQSPFAEANRQAADRANAWEAIKGNLPALGLMAGLSMLANNNGSRSFGQLVGRAGADALGGLGNMMQAQNAMERYRQQQNMAMAEAARKRQKDAWDMGMQAAQFGLDRDELALKRANHDAELAGWRMLQGMVDGGMGVPSAGPGGAGGAPNSSNPLNMRVPGSTDFQSFDSPGDAFNAYLGQLRRYQGRGLMTPAQMIAGDDVNGQYVPGWAPAADGNDTDAYIGNVGKWSGLDMHAPINLDDPVAVSRLMSGMARMEQKDGARFTPEVIQAALSGQSANTGENPAAGGLSPTIGLLPGSAGQAGRWLYEQQANANQRALNARTSDPAFIIAQENAKAVPGKINALSTENGELYDSMRNFEALSSLYGRGLETGAWAPMRSWLANQAEALGIGDYARVMGLPDASVQQEFENLVTQNVFNVLAQQKGVQTEGDAQRAAQTWASIKNTPQANMWIATLQKNVAQRQIDINDKTMELLEKHNGNMRLVNAELKKYKDGLPSIIPNVPGMQKRTTGSNYGGLGSASSHSSYGFELPPGFVEVR